MVKKQQQGSRLIGVLKPLMSLLPDVGQANPRTPVKTRGIWLLFVVLIYLVYSQLPLVGISKHLTPDPFSWMRIILASHRGTQTDLGVSPLLTASLIMQLLTGLKLIKIDLSDYNQRKIFQGGQKVITVFISLFQAIVYTMSGLYGTQQQLGNFNIVVIILQLWFSSFVILLLDDIIQKGYGIGNSGSQIFIGINVALSILWTCFSPLRFINPNGINQFQGIFFALIAVVFQNQPLVAFQRVIFRGQASNLLNLFATILIYLIVIFLQGFKVKYQLSSSKAMKQTYQIPLFYTSNRPVMLFAALVINVQLFSLFLFSNIKDNLLVNLLGYWQIQQNRMVPVSGLTYLMSPPNQFIDIFINPAHTLIYILFVVIVSGIFSKRWVQFSKISPRQVSKNLKNQGFYITGQRDKGTQDILRKNIPSAALLGGMLIGFLMTIADFLGAVGTGSGVLLGTTIISSYTQQIRKQKQKLSLANLFS